MAARKPVLKAVDAPDVRQNRTNLFDLAYRQIEEMLVDCRLAPGALLTMDDLRAATGLGRTPVHHAVNRLAADTLIEVRPRHGLRIAAIDLARERMLLRLRKDLERFVVRLATERSGPRHRNQFLHLERLLRERGTGMTLASFNQFDRNIDQMILTAAGEPFLAHTLRPLHTMFRRIGFVYHTHIAAGQSLDATVDRHLAILNAIANGHIEKAIAASDALIDFVDGMFERMENEIEPGLLDSTIEPLIVL